jgi:hypothetical protein
MLFSFIRSLFWQRPYADDKLNLEEGIMNNSPKFFDYGISSTLTSSPNY